MASFKWVDEYSVGISEMDSTHKAFVEQVDVLLAVSDDRFRDLFRELLDHTRRHFAREGELMRESGFPPIQIHEGEHLRVLEEFERVASLMTSEDLDSARGFVRQLPEWFSTHAATMDRALGFHLQQLRGFQEVEVPT